MFERENFATKAEVENVRNELANGELETRRRVTEVWAQVVKTQSVASDTKAAVADVKSEVYKWVAGILVGHTVIVVGIVVAVVRLLDGE